MFTKLTRVDQVSCWSRRHCPTMSEFKVPPMMSTTIADFTWPVPFKQEKAKKPVSALADASGREPDVNFETLAYRIPGQHIPLSQFIEVNPIHGTIPQAPLVPEEPLELPFQRIRVPKISHAPAGSMDDAAELLGGADNTFELLKTFTYSTTWGKAAGEAVPDVKPTPHPDAKTTCFEEESAPWKATPVPPYNAPPSSCDRLNLQHLQDLRTDYSKKPPSYTLHDPLDALVSKESVDEIKRLIKVDRLRYAYDVPHPTYTGHFPHSPVALAMEVFRPPIASPMLPAQESYLRRTAKPDDNCGIQEETVNK